MLCSGEFSPPGGATGPVLQRVQTRSVSVVRYTGRQGAVKDQIYALLYRRKMNKIGLGLKKKHFYSLIWQFPIFPENSQRSFWLKLKEAQKLVRSTDHISPEFRQNI